MKQFPRYLLPQIRKDLKQKMVFVGGPRQVGKTTLAHEVLRDAKIHETAYLNWDIPEHRERILQQEWPHTSLWVFDEIHKYRAWRNVLKGIYDHYHTDKQVLVTGSARLDVYRHGGDSLQGRYHYLRLHPLSVAELRMTHTKDLLDLLKFGGFPEPFFRGTAIDAKRWSREYRTRLIQEDLLPLERISDLGKIELLMLRLPHLVGSPLSLNAIREDLEVSHKTVANWLNIFEKLYVLFRLPPFGAPSIRAVKKEQKHYHFDWTLPTELGLCFENLVACHLLKWVHFQQDVKGEDIELRYFRDIDGREVDFVIVKEGKPLMAVEAKWNDDEITQGLRYLKARFSACAMWQISATGKKDYQSREGIRVTPAVHFLKELV
jgi:predicted AAA+ superfamily ATPase